MRIPRGKCHEPKITGPCESPGATLIEGGGGVPLLKPRIVCLQVFMLRGLLIHIARALDSVFRGHPFALLYFVMLCCPLLMNLLQVNSFCHDHPVMTPWR